MAEEASTTALVRRINPFVAGEQHGRLTAISFVRRSKDRKRAYWLFRCECGGEITTDASQVRSGKCRSCGCYRKEVHSRNRGLPGAGNGMFKHGLSHKSECLIWHGMIRRCYVPSAPGFERWGGRGITVCDRWRESFVNFLVDMGERPSPSHSLDRWPDKDGDYEPGNCRWATRKQQARNTRSNRMVTYQGRVMALAEACELSGINYLVAQSRLKRGLNDVDALTPGRRKSGTAPRR